jgi:type IV secretory pathway TraG/TraD family ATPase VirD4
MLVGLIQGRAEIRRILLSPLLAVPLAGLAGVGAALAGPVAASLGLLGSGTVQVAVGATMGAVLGYFGGRSASHEVDRKLHQRGSIVKNARGRGVTATGAECLRPSSSGGPQITLAGIPIPVADETKHFKLIGTTGTGKSTAIRELLESALSRGDRAVIADPDAGYLKEFHNAARGDVVMNPFDHRSVKWDLFAEIRNPYDIDQLARSLIPDKDAAERSWRGYARTFFAAVTRQAHEGGVTDTGELYRLLVVAESAELRTLVRGTPAQPFLEEQNSRMFDSIRSVTSSAVSALEFIGQQTGRAFSIRRWVKEEGRGVLFMPYKAGQIAALHSTISAWMRLAIFEAMDREAEQVDLAGKCGAAAAPLWFVVDELDALGQIDGLKDALARLRKFGGRCVLGFQSIAQVSGTYGQADARTIVENCGNTLILRCSASEGGGTARFASQLIGEREVLRLTKSRSRRAADLVGAVSSSEQFNVEPAVLPSQIEQLPDLAGFLKHASDPAWRRVRLAAAQEWQARRAEHSLRREFDGLDRGGMTND